VSVDHFECREWSRVEHVILTKKQPPKSTKEDAYFLIMDLHTCMCNINLDSLLWKQSELRNYIEECVLTMGYLCKITLPIAMPSKQTPL
jgi:hypothetical protein